MLNQIFSEAKGRWRPRGHALSMARESSVGWACGWLVSAVFWLWIERKLRFPGPFSKPKMKCACTFGRGAPATFSESAELSCACPIFRCEKFAEPTRYGCFRDSKQLCENLSFSTFIYNTYQLQLYSPQPLSPNSLFLLMQAELNEWVAGSIKIWIS